MMPRCFILCGGYAKRLGTETEHIPKSLVLLNGQPMILAQLSRLKDAGVTDVVLCVGHLGHLIREVVDDGTALGMRVRYSDDGISPKGTGGALRLALAHYPSDRAFVLYGDVLLDVDFQKFADDHDAMASPFMMAISRNGSLLKQNVQVHDGMVEGYNKLEPIGVNAIDAGLACLRGDVLDSWPVGAFFDLSETIRLLVCRKKVSAFELTTPVLDIGDPDSLELTRLVMR